MSQRRLASVFVGLLVACEPSPSQTDAPSPAEHPAAPAPALEPEPTPAASPQSETNRPAHSASTTGPSLCVKMCEVQGRARAVAAEVVRRECTARCQGNPTPTQECLDAAKQARTRVEAVPMQARAPKAWAVVGNADLMCGYSDPFTQILDRAATDDGPARQTALIAALDADPFAAETCPSGTPPVSADATATDAIASCGLDDPPEGWHAHVGALTFLAVRAVRLRYAALGLETGDHGTLLDILTLASALERE